MASRAEHVIASLIESAGQQFAIGQVAAVAAPKVSVVTTGGANLLVSRLSTWTPAPGDVVLIAKTSLGWVAIGKIQT